MDYVQGILLVPVLPVLNGHLCLLYCKYFSNTHCLVVLLATCCMFPLWLHYMHAYGGQLLLQLTQRVLFVLHIGGDHVDLGGPDSDFGSHDIIWLRWPGMV